MFAIDKAKKSESVLAVDMPDFASLYDEQFSFSDFKEAIVKEEEHSDSVLDSARKALEKAFSESEGDTEYVLDLDKEQKHAIEVGDILLDTDKDGQIFAQYRMGDGSYGKKIPVKKQLEKEGLTQKELLLALQMEAIKEQLNSMIETLSVISEDIKGVATGQRNDRIGLYYSGLSIYAEANCVSDAYLKRQLFAQAVKSLNDANSQLIQDVRTSIEYLINEKYKKRKDSVSRIEENLHIIKQCYDIVNRTAFLKAMIYKENNELPAMLMAMQEYGRFVEKLIVPYIGKLSELDKNEIFIEKGSWGMIADTLGSCKELSKQISEERLFLLEKKEKGYGN